MRVLETARDVDLRQWLGGKEEPTPYQVQFALQTPRDATHGALMADTVDGMNHLVEALLQTGGGR
jgi:hypothetical protein